MVIACSGQFSTPSFLCTLLTLRVDNLLFSVDSPNETNREAVDFLKHLPLGDVDKEKIAHRKAERMLRL